MRDTQLLAAFAALVAHIDGRIRTAFHSSDDDGDDDDDFIALSFSVDFSNGTLSLLLPVLLLLTLSSYFKEGLSFSVLVSTSRKHKIHNLNAINMNPAMSTLTIMRVICLWSMGTNGGELMVS